VSSKSQVRADGIHNQRLPTDHSRDEPGKYPKDLDAHIHQAFKNVEKALKDAGGKGWEEVYSVTTYHVPLDDASLGVCVKYFKEYMSHKPLWTAVGVPNLAEKEMQIEIVVKAKTQW
jgi:enamine deaminase RidA (YjgF/YER057c/UK114 family)